MGIPKNPFPFDPGPHILHLTGTWLSARCSAYPPSSTSGNRGRFNGPCTGSIYLADSEATCEAEVVDLAGRTLFELEVSSSRTLDLAAIESAGHPIEPYLQASGSHGGRGWDPSNDVSDWAYANKIQGIKYPSRAKSGGECLMLFPDHLEVSDSAFREVKVYRAGSTRRRVFTWLLLLLIFVGVGVGVLGC